MPSEHENVKKQSLIGVVWKLLEKGGTQAVSMVVQIVLARLLMPSDYGIIGYLTLFMTLSDVFLKQGFTTALVQKKDADNLDFSTVFFANIGAATIIYIIFFFAAPYVALFYKEPRLTSIMRVLTLEIFTGAFGAVHWAIMAKNLEFRKSFVRGLAFTVVYGISGITFAYLGFGVWSLVFGKLIGSAVGSLIYWATVKWRPEFKFSFSRLKQLFSFSSRVLGTNILNTLYNNINSLIIGRFYTSADLGYYQRGQSIPQTIMTTVDGSMSEVMYPAFSKMQGDVDVMKSALRRSMRLSMYMVYPILFGFLAIAKPLTLILLTEKWLPSVPYMQLTCLICMFWPLSARTHALNAMGKSKVTFRLSLIGKVVSVSCILIFVRFGVIYIMVGSIVSAFINFWIVSVMVRKHLNYSIIELLKDIGPTLLSSVIMCAVVYSVSFLNLSSLFTLLIQIPVGVAVYMVLTKLFHIDSFDYILSTVKGYLPKFQKT